MLVGKYKWGVYLTAVLICILQFRSEKSEAKIHRITDANGVRYVGDTPEDQAAVDKMYEVCGYKRPGSSDGGLDPNDPRFGELLPFSKEKERNADPGKDPSKAPPPSDPKVTPKINQAFKSCISCHSSGSGVRARVFSSPSDVLNYVNAMSASDRQAKRGKFEDMIANYARFDGDPEEGRRTILNYLGYPE